MATKKNELASELRDTIWAAGVLSMSGSLSLVKSKQTKVVRLTFTSSSYLESISKLSAISGAAYFVVKGVGNPDKPTLRIAIQGASLHALMTRVWEYLTTERKRQYAVLRKEITTTLEGNNPYKQDTDSFEEDD